MNPEIDKENMLAILDDFPNQVNNALALGTKLKVEGVDRILVCGMGGSAISGDILKAYLSKEIEIDVSKEYDVPLFVNRKTLAFIVSYSGDTEETVSAYRACVSKGAKIVIICSGGKLEELSRVNKTAIIKIPKGLPPRLATGYLFFPMLNVLQTSELIKDKNDEINETLKLLKQNIYKENGMEFAKKLVDRIPLIYSSSKYFPVAEKWKTDINENAKTHAFYNVFSEFNHNEINGYVNLNGDFYAIIMKDENETPRIEKRMKIIKKIIQDKGVPAIEMRIKGNSYLAKLFSALYLGLYVSYFLALELDTDPTPVKIIQDLKEQLKK